MSHFTGFKKKTVTTAHKEFLSSFVVSDKRKSHQFYHVGFLHWWDSAADDTGAHTAKLDEVGAQRVVQGFGQALAGNYKLVVWSHPKIRRKRKI